MENLQSMHFFDRVQIGWQRWSLAQQGLALVLVIGLPMIMAIIVFHLGQYRRISLELTFDGGVGSPGCRATYDHLGYYRKVKFNGRAEFDLEGPVYEVDPMLLPGWPPTGASAGFCGPERISPDLVLQGTPLYPLHFTYSVPEWVVVGESFPLEATIGITNAFSSDGLYYAITMPITDSLDVQFQLATTTFDFAPANEQVITQELSFSSLPQQTWILSPKESVAGGQAFHIYLKNSQGQLQNKMAQITSTVRSPLGIDMRIVTVLTPIGTFVMSVATLLFVLSGTAKQMLESQQLYAQNRRSNTPNQAGTPMHTGSNAKQPRRW